MMQKASKVGALALLLPSQEGEGLQRQVAIDQEGGVIDVEDANGRPSSFTQNKEQKESKESKNKAAFLAGDGAAPGQAGDTSDADSTGVLHDEASDSDAAGKAVAVAATQQVFGNALQGKHINDEARASATPVVKAENL
ncbi:unnamed protein product [Amoebophrya sp. A25]|nr:unnamed protein product [Amoebophrya sp. A25]|eukprot:GSA25T00006692001.1